MDRTKHISRSIKNQLIPQINKEIFQGRVRQERWAGEERRGKIGIFQGHRDNRTWRNNSRPAEEDVGMWKRSRPGWMGLEVLRCGVCRNNTPQFINSAFNAPTENKISANNSQGAFPVSLARKKIPEAGIECRNYSCEPFCWTKNALQKEHFWISSSWKKHGIKNRKKGN